MKYYMMGSSNEDSSKDLLEAQSHLWNHTLSYINSMSLKCAVELNIPSIIHKYGKPIAISNLSTALSLPPSKTPGLRRLMRLLVHSKFFSEHEELYSLTKFSKILISENNINASLSPFVRFVLDQTFLSPWHRLSDWFNDDEIPTAFEMAHGKPIWDYTSETVEFNKMMKEGLSTDGSFITEIIVRDCGEVFQGLSSLVDVGGGTGVLAHVIAEAFPTVKCTVLELPHVIEQLEESERVRFVAGDMFDFVPPADATLLKWVLHDWSDQECVKILKRCKEAIPCKEDGGKVIIIDMVMNTNNINHKLVETQFAFDLHMLVHTTGKQRSEDEWKKIFDDAGFRGYKILPILGLRSVIEVYP